LRVAGVTTPVTSTRRLRTTECGFKISSKPNAKGKPTRSPPRAANFEKRMWDR
jgi:hypothetical protein